MRKPALTLWLLLAAATAFAHSQHDQTRYVSSDGADAGQCDDPAAPCQTIAYAATRAGKGDKVLVARGRYGIRAPAVTGNEHFERYFRVQMNTLEQLVLFIPAIWLFAQFVDPLWAAAMGGVYLVGRSLYFLSYVKNPASRTAGFALSTLPTLLMLAGVLWQALRMLFLR